MEPEKYLAMNWVELIAHCEALEARCRELEELVRDAWSVMNAHQARHVRKAINDRMSGFWRESHRNKAASSMHWLGRAKGVCPQFTLETPPKYGTCSLCGGTGGAHLTTCQHSPAFKAETKVNPPGCICRYAHKSDPMCQYESKIKGDET